MHQLDFNALPRISRERFVLALDSPPPVGPILGRRAPPALARGWAALAACSVAGLGLVALVGFGGIATPVQDRRYLVGYVFISGLLGFAIATLARRRVTSQLLPFPPGVYVFAHDLVDARTRTFELYPLIELLSVDPVHRAVNGVYDHTVMWLVFPTVSFTFEIRGIQASSHCRAAILEARQAIDIALQRGDAAAILPYDPFSEARAAGFPAVDEPGPVAKSPPIWASFVWAIGLVSAFVLGVATWRGRNALSDARAFAALSARPDPHDVLLYLSAGGLHADALKSTVLPRARLAAAKAETGTRRADALDRFLKDYPHSDVDAEARAALADAVHAEFAVAKTPTELRAFLGRWPAAPDAAAAKGALHASLGAILTDLRQHPNMAGGPSVIGAKSGAADETVVGIFGSLFAWEEQHPEAIEVHFRRRGTRGLGVAEGLLAKGVLDDDGAAPSGNASIMALFATERLADREAAMVRGLERTLRGALGQSAVSLAAGAPIADDEADRALERPPPEATAKAKKGRPTSGERPPRPFSEPSAPTLIVDYSVGWNGLTYLARGRRRRFLGIVLRCDVTLAVPSPTRALGFSLKVDAPETLAVEPGDAGADDAAVYDAMLERAFEGGAGQLAGILFDAKTAAARTPDSKSSSVR